MIVTVNDAPHVCSHRRDCHTRVYTGVIATCVYTQARFATRVYTATNTGESGSSLI